MCTIRITNQLFTGNGQYSLAVIGHLFTRLADAINILGGLQQPPHSTDIVNYRDEDSRKDLEEELQRIAKEIYLALTGKKV